MSFCPQCLRNCLSTVFGGNPGQKSYNGQRQQIEEEQFINPHLSDQIQKNTSKINQYFIETKTPEDNPKEKVKVEEYKNSMGDDDIEKLIDAQLNNSPPALVGYEVEGDEQRMVVSIKKQADLSQRFLDSASSEIDFTTFSINLDPLDPYYELLSEKTFKMSEYFNLKGKPLSIKDNTKSNLKIYEIEVKKGICFRISYQIKCSYSYFTSIIKNQKLQMTHFSTNIAEIKIVQSFKNNLTKNSIKLKKIAKIEPRNFVYFRYSNGMRGQNWEIYINDDAHQKLENEKQSKTCEVFSIINSRESANGLIINQYLELDLKMSSYSSILSKLIGQFKVYVANIYDYVESNYEKQLV